jgi:O-antigen ligase
MNYCQGFLFAPLVLLSPNSAVPVFLFWLGISGWYKNAWIATPPMEARNDESGVIASFAAQSRFGYISQAFPQDILKILALFLGWACLSSLWSLSPYDSAIASVKLLAFVLLGLSWLSFCSQKSANTTFLFLKGLTIGCSGVALFMLTDYALGEAFVRFRGGSSIKVYSAVSHTLALCFYPLCFWLYKQIAPWLSFLFALLIIAALYTIDIDIILVALVLGALIQGFAFLLQRKIFKYFWQWCFGLLLITFPFICEVFLTPAAIQTINLYIPLFSYIHRLHIWHFLSEKIVQNPWIGYGLDTTHLYKLIHPPLYTWTFFEKITNNPIVIQNTPLHQPLFFHAHNVIIQWWFELGLVGILLSGLFFIKVFVRIHQWPHPQRIMTFGYSATVIAIALVSVDFWQSWWFSALWISSGIVILVNRTLDQEARRQHVLVTDNK